MIHSLILFDFRAQTDGWQAKCACGWMGGTYWPDVADAETEYEGHVRRVSQPG